MAFAPEMWVSTLIIIKAGIKACKNILRMLSLMQFELNYINASNDLSRITKVNLNVAWDFLVF